MLRKSNIIRTQVVILVHRTCYHPTANRDNLYITFRERKETSKIEVTSNEKFQFELHCDVFVRDTTIKCQCIPKRLLFQVTFLQSKPSDEKMKVNGNLWPLCLNVDRQNYTSKSEAY